MHTDITIHATTSELPKLLPLSGTSESVDSMTSTIIQSSDSNLIQLVTGQGEQTTPPSDSFLPTEVDNIFTGLDEGGESFAVIEGEGQTIQETSQVEEPETINLNTETSENVGQVGEKEEEIAQEMIEAIIQEIEKEQSVINVDNQANAGTGENQTDEEVLDIDIVQGSEDEVEDTNADEEGRHPDTIEQTTEVSDNALILEQNTDGVTPDADLEQIEAEQQTDESEQTEEIINEESITGLENTELPVDEEQVTIDEQVETTEVEQTDENIEQEQIVVTNGADEISEGDGGTDVIDEDQLTDVEQSEITEQEFETTQGQENQIIPVDVGQTADDENKESIALDEQIIEDEQHVVNTEQTQEEAAIPELESEDQSNTVEETESENIGDKQTTDAELITVTESIDTVDLHEESISLATGTETYEVESNIGEETVNEFEETTTEKQPIDNQEESQSATGIQVHEIDEQTSEDQESVVSSIDEEINSETSQDIGEQSETADDDEPQQDVESSLSETDVTNENVLTTDSDASVDGQDAASLVDQSVTDSEQIAAQAGVGQDEYGINEEDRPTVVIDEQIIEGAESPVSLSQTSEQGITIIDDIETIQEMMTTSNDFVTEEPNNAIDLDNTETVENEVQSGLVTGFSPSGVEGENEIISTDESEPIMPIVPQTIDSNVGPVDEQKLEQESSSTDGTEDELKGTLASEDEENILEAEGINELETGPLTYIDTQENEIDSSDTLINESEVDLVPVTSTDATTQIDEEQDTSTQSSQTDDSIISFVNEETISSDTPIEETGEILPTTPSSIDENIISSSPGGAEQTSDTDSTTDSDSTTETYIQPFNNDESAIEQTVDEESAPEIPSSGDSVIDETSGIESSVVETDGFESVVQDASNDGSVVDKVGGDESTADKTSSVAAGVDETSGAESVAQEATGIESVVGETSGNEAVSEATDGNAVAIDETSGPESIAEETEGGQTIGGETSETESVVDEISPVDDSSVSTTSSKPEETGEVVIDIDAPLVNKTKPILSFETQEDQLLHRLNTSSFKESEYIILESKYY